MRFRKSLLVGSGLPILLIIAGDCLPQLAATSILSHNFPWLLRYLRRCKAISNLLMTTTHSTTALFIGVFRLSMCEICVKFHGLNNGERTVQDSSFDR